MNRNTESGVNVATEPQGATPDVAASSAGHEPASQAQGVPLSPAPEPHVRADATVPLARNRALVAPRAGMVANFGDWWRSLASGMTRLVTPTKRKRKVPQRLKTQAMPAIARANREISILRIENARLRRLLDAQQPARKPSARKRNEPTDD